MLIFCISAYTGKYIYENSQLKQVSHPEGYVTKENNSYKYVYQYKDHLGNVRLSYANIGIASASQLEIIEENNYYPFGLQHKGYNNIINGLKNNYKTDQGQELHEDLGLNVLEFKWRIHDPTIGRFWQVDPLAKDYPYNGVYNFAENKVIQFNELEGLEIATPQFYLEVGQRAGNLYGGFQKMIKGGTNAFNDAASGDMATRKIVESKQNMDNDKLVTDQNMELVLEGASQIDKALPSKQDIRDAANAGEVVGDGLVVSSFFTGPAAPATAGVGETISTVSTLTNIGLDLSEGKVKNAAKRAVIEVISGGLSSIAKKNKHVDQFAEQAIDAHFIFYENVVVPQVEKEMNE